MVFACPVRMSEGGVCEAPGYVFENLEHHA
jgi:hypothetical protein